jgi:hypothetical protein
VAAIPIATAFAALAASPELVAISPQREPMDEANTRLSAAGKLSNFSGATAVNRG